MGIIVWIPAGVPQQNWPWMWSMPGRELHLASFLRYCGFVQIRTLCCDAGVSDNLLSQGPQLNPFVLLSSKTIFAVSRYLMMLQLKFGAILKYFH